MPALKFVRKGEAYEPNWSDPRVKTRVERVVAFLLPHSMGVVAEVQAHHDVLNEHFGPSGNKLSAFLRTKLLGRKPGAQYMPGKRSLTWQIKTGYLAALQARYGLEHDPVEVLRERYKDELTTLTFSYTDRSDRLWHPLQNIPRTKARDFWLSYLPHDYDVVACAPTLLSQTARKLGLIELLQEQVVEYLEDRNGFRGHVMALTGLEYQDAKRLINGLFNGARLSRNPYCTAYRLLDYDYAAMTRLMEDEKVKALRRNIKHIWWQISRKVGAVSNRDRWRLYFRMERKVLDSVRRYLDAKGAHYLLMHDGWRTSASIDVADLKRHLQRETGFDLEIEGS